MNYFHPHRATVNLTTANTEYSYTFPADTKKLIMQMRSGEEWKMAFKTGDIALGNYFTVHQGIAKVEENLNLAATLPIYFSCPESGEVMEVEFWT